MSVCSFKMVVENVETFPEMINSENVVVSIYTTIPENY